MATEKEEGEEGVELGVSQIVPGAHTSPIVTRRLVGEKTYIQAYTHSSSSS